MIWNEVFEYDNGLLRWKVSRGRVAKGQVAGRLTLDGYRHICYCGNEYYAHRIIYEMFKGPIPKGFEIDHINQDKDDNRIENLRLATPSQNKANKYARKDSSTGIRGVYWSKQKKKWHCQIQVNKKRKHIGFYDNIEEATKAYRYTLFHYFGEFAVESNELD